MILRDVDVCNCDIPETMWPPQQCLNKSFDPRTERIDVQFSFLRRTFFHFNSKTREKNIMVKILTKHQLRWTNSSLLLPPQMTATSLWCHWNTIVTGTTSNNPQVPSKLSVPQTLDVLICSLTLHQGGFLLVLPNKTPTAWLIRCTPRNSLVDLMQGTYITVQEYHPFTHVHAH